jgi:hypothetical protein
MDQRREELMKELNPHCHTIFNACYDFMEKSIASSFSTVTPDVVRKIELLEALLFGFVEHAVNLDLLDEIEQQIATASMRGVKRDSRTVLQ